MQRNKKSRSIDHSYKKKHDLVVCFSNYGHINEKTSYAEMNVVLH